MLTILQANEIKRLASLAATKRVRYYAAKQGLGNAKETIKGTESAVRKSKSDLDNYIDSLTSGPIVPGRDTNAN
jgi:hypothetical protein